MKKNSRSTHPEKFSYYLNKLNAKALGLLRHNGVKAYWWRSVPNAGDLVTPALLQLYGLTPIHTWKAYAEVVSCGSVLQNLPDDYSGSIIGSGILNPSVPLQLNNALILALRGELTRDHIGAPKVTPLGDPGLLAVQLIENRMEKRYPVGIVPHYSEKNHPNIRQLCERYPDMIHFIDIQRKLKLVLAEIDQCETILSSSLHGLVFADALGIPCTWIVLTDPVPASKSFKYLDYNSALRRDQQPVYLQGTEDLSKLTQEATQPDQDRLAHVQHELDVIFTRFAEGIRGKN